MNSMKHTFPFLLLLFLFFSGCAHDYPNGVESKNYKTEFEKWQTLAEQGEAIAQYNLGLIYEKGEGVIQDYREGAKWYLKSAEQGHAPAQGHRLGLVQFCRA